MDLVNTAIVAFVAFVFIGGTMAYVAGPPPALDELAPDPVANDPACSAGDGCEVESEPPISIRIGTPDGKDDDGEDDDDDDQKDGERRGKGKPDKD